MAGQFYKFTHSKLEELEGESATLQSKDHGRSSHPNYYERDTHIYKSRVTTLYRLRQKDSRKQNG